MRVVFTEVLLPFHGQAPSSSGMCRSLVEPHVLDTAQAF